MADKTTADDTAAAAEAPAAGQVRHYPVLQPDGSTRAQLVLVTHVSADGDRVFGVPVGWADQQASFEPGMLA